MSLFVVDVCLSEENLSKFIKKYFSLGVDSQNPYIFVTFLHTAITRGLELLHKLQSEHSYLSSTLKVVQTNSCSMVIVYTIYTLPFFYQIHVNYYIVYVSHVLT